MLRSIAVETGWSVAPGAEGTDDWLSLLDRYRVEFAALSTRRDSQRVELLRSHGDWEVQYREGDTILLARVPHSGMGPVGARQAIYGTASAIDS
jgi:hypothetical protein